MLACYAFRIVVEKRRLQARFTKMRLEISPSKIQLSRR